MKRPAIIHRQLIPGTRVKLIKSMGITEGSVTYRMGTVKERESGDDFIINIEYAGRHRAERLSGIDAHRYLSEIEEAFIDGRWQRIWEC